MVSVCPDPDSTWMAGAPPGGGEGSDGASLEQAAARTAAATRSGRAEHRGRLGTIGAWMQEGEGDPKGTRAGLVCHRDSYFLTSSTRRFCWRPSGVVLGAAGTVSPNPMVVSRLPSIL